MRSRSLAESMTGPISTSPLRRTRSRPLYVKCRNPVFVINGSTAVISYVPSYDSYVQYVYVYNYVVVLSKYFRTKINVVLYSTYIQRYFRTIEYGNRYSTYNFVVVHVHVYNYFRCFRTKILRVQRTVHVYSTRTRCMYCTLFYLAYKFESTCTEILPEV